MQRRRQKKLVRLLRFSRIDAFQQHVSDVDLRLRLVTRNGPRRATVACHEPRNGHMLP
jgi:hypothetical protein